MMIESSQGVEVAVHDFGGSGPILVIAHATGFHGMAYEPFAQALSNDFHCVAFDFRGHGTSTFPAEASLAWTDDAADLMAVMDSLSPADPLRVFGHSLGGAVVALAVAEQPDRFRSVFTYEPVLLPYVEGLDYSPIAAAAARRRPHFESRAEAEQNYFSKPPLNQLHPDAMAAYVAHGFYDSDQGGVELACSPEVEAQVFRHANSGALNAAKMATIPFAVAAGSRDTLPTEAARSAAASSENLTLVQSELGHFGPLENPAVVAQMVRDWF